LIQILFAASYFVVASICVLMISSTTEDKSQWAAAAVLFAFAWLTYRRLASLRDGFFPLVGLAIFYHLLAFVWPLVNGELLGELLFTENQRIGALLIVASGLVGMTLGASLYRSAYDVPLRPMRAGLERNSFGNPSSWAVFGVSLWGAQLVFKLFVGTVAGFDALLQLCQSLGTAFLAASVLSGHTGRRWVIGVALAVILYELVLKLATGSLAGPVFLLSQLLALRYYFKKKFGAVELAFAAMALVVVFSLQSAKQEYRLRFWSTDSTASAMDRAIGFAQLAIQWSPWGANESRDAELTDSFERRSSNIAALMTVVEMTPESVPYRNGETLLPLTYMWIPRVLWPEKPQATLGNDWAKDYNLLGAGDFSTSYNLPWLIEFYLNFGGIGVFLGMCWAGYVLRLLERLFFAPTASPFSAIVGVALVGNLWWLESNVSLTLGNLFSQAIVTILLSYVFRTFFFRTVNRRDGASSSNG
jgi:hypothetical protein